MANLKTRVKHWQWIWPFMSSWQNAVPLAHVQFYLKTANIFIWRKHLAGKMLNSPFPFNSPLWNNSLNSCHLQNKPLAPWRSEEGTTVSRSPASVCRQGASSLSARNVAALKDDRILSEVLSGAVHGSEAAWRRERSQVVWFIVVKKSLKAK